MINWIVFCYVNVGRHNNNAPFRQVGKAEMLLHRFLGPYEVIRKTTNLNYEVGLKEGKKDKSDIVHVVAMKPFYPFYPFYRSTKK